MQKDYSFSHTLVEVSFVFNYDVAWQRGSVATRQCGQVVRVLDLKSWGRALIRGSCSITGLPPSSCDFQA